jgi:uncharacterized protein YkwD
MIAVAVSILLFPPAMLADSLASGPVAMLQNGTSAKKSIDAVLPETEEVKQRYAVVELTNRIRERQNLPPLKVCDDLMEVADLHAEDMARRNYFDHRSRDGRTMYDRLKTIVPIGSQGENIAAGQESPESVIASWSRSPGHRENMLNREFREIGVGWATNEKSEYGTYWVQDFCGRDGIWPVIINGEAFETNSTTVSIFIYAPSDTVRMRISNDNGDFGPWQSVAERLKWTIGSGKGVHRVTVQTEDRDGLQTTASDTIRLK